MPGRVLGRSGAANSYRRDGLHVVRRCRLTSLWPGPGPGPGPGLQACRRAHLDVGDSLLLLGRMARF